MKKHFSVIGFVSLLSLLLFINTIKASAVLYLSIDSIELEEVNIVKKAKRYQAGAKITFIGKNILEKADDVSLERLLKQYAAIPIKSNAGSLSTIRFRGTSPNHTSINVGGINLNSLTLGSSNLSNIPVFFFDDLMLQYGSASVVNGSGSIGGSLNFSTEAKWTKGSTIYGRITYGSFGEQFYGAKVYVGNGKFESASKIYYFDKKNNFTFLHPPTKDFENGEMIQVKDVQRNASINNKGFMQEFGFKFNKQQFWRFMIWVEDDWHQIQQNMSTNLNQPGKSEEIEDKHIRIWNYYNNNKNKLKRRIGAGYVLDNEIYNKDTNSPIQTNRFITDGDIEYPVFSSTGNIKGGYKLEIISPNVYAYDINGELQYQTDLYASYRQTLFSKLKLSLNLRKGFVTDFTVPFTPALGFACQVMVREYSRIELSGNVSKSYRIPTFNDRYWVPGGNPDLLPEKGINYELGGKYSLFNKNVEMTVLLNAFYMDVDNWILWKNSGAYWTAANVQKVVSMGVELQSNLKVRFNSKYLALGLNYTLNSAERKKSSNITAALNRQLEYVPFHTISLYTQFNIENWNFYVDVNGMSWQYTNEEPYNILDGYALTNVSADYSFKIKKRNRFKATFNINNIFNINYYSSWNYAMPRIGFKGTIAYFFN